MMILIDSYTKDDVQLQWMDDDPVEVDEEELSLPQFELVNISTRHCKDMFKTGQYPTHKLSCPLPDNHFSHPCD